ncbi:MAG: hypothetical protein BGO29_03915 [Bacteroidales bacterium 36-12]|nr:MAG: hypothetical protein BGO29_03915 [Bacteroidales bacterium 36-12]
MLAIVYYPLHATVYNINQSSGAISVHQTYVNNMSDEWNINIGVNKAVKLVFNTDLETCCDYLRIYNVDNSGNLTQLAAMVGAQSGTIYTLTPNGKVKITFTTDHSIDYQDGYTGFDVNFSVDDRYQVTNGVNVTGDANFNNNVNINGKLGLGTSTPRENLDVNGNAIFSERVGIGTTPSNNKLYVYNYNQEYTGFRAYTYKSTSSTVYGIHSSTYNPSGPVLGIYSYVSGGGSNNQRWSGYFSGGDVEITGGKLRAKSKIAVYPSSITSDEGYNGEIMITRPASSGQYINLVRSGQYPWSIGTVYNTSNFAIGKGVSNDANFTSPFFTINTIGNVGIGTTNPQYVLDVNGKIYTNDEVIVSRHNIDIGGTVSIVNPAKTEPGQASTWNIYNMGGTYGNSLQFWAYDNTGCGGGMCNSRLTLMDSGNVGIGISNPQHKLDVKGTIRATEVLVQSVDQFADFVFDDDYRLRPLTEVNSFIKNNKHLPGIPSATEVKENGMSLVEMQVKLLLKIEELTLYAIDLQKTIDLQNAKIEVLEQKVK